MSKKNEILVKIIAAILTVLIKEGLDKICEPSDEDEKE